MCVYSGSSIIKMMNWSELFCFTLIFANCLTRALSWQQEAILDSEGRIAFYWTVDVKKNVLLFEVQARTSGYVGLGISPDGTMAKADIMVGYMDSEGEPIVRDYWASKNGALEKENSHDWKLLAGRQNDSHLMLRVRRALRPIDNLDAIIYDMPTWIIWSWHPEDPLPGQLPQYHGKSRRGAKQLCIIEPGCFSSTEDSSITGHGQSSDAPPTTNIQGPFGLLVATLACILRSLSGS